MRTLLSCGGLASLQRAWYARRLRELAGSLVRNYAVQMVALAEFRGRSELGHVVRVARCVARSEEHALSMVLSQRRIAKIEAGLSSER